MKHTSVMPNLAPPLSHRGPELTLTLISYSLKAITNTSCNLSRKYGALRVQNPNPNTNPDFNPNRFPNAKPLTHRGPEPPLAAISPESTER